MGAAQDESSEGVRRAYNVVLTVYDPYQMEAWPSGWSITSSAGFERATRLLQAEFATPRFTRMCSRSTRSQRGFVLREHVLNARAKLEKARIRECR